jgi:hypothetical protein
MERPMYFLYRVGSGPRADLCDGKYWVSSHSASSFVLQSSFMSIFVSGHQFSMVHARSKTEIGLFGANHIRL